MNTPLFDTYLRKKIFHGLLLSFVLLVVGAFIAYKELAPGRWMLSPVPPAPMLDSNSPVNVEPKLDSCVRFLKSNMVNIQTTDSTYASAFRLLVKDYRTKHALERLKQKAAALGLDSSTVALTPVPKWDYAAFFLPIRAVNLATLTDTVCACKWLAQDSLFDKGFLSNDTLWSAVTLSVLKIQQPAPIRFLGLFGATLFLVGLFSLIRYGYYRLNPYRHPVAAGLTGPNFQELTQRVEEHLHEKGSKFEPGDPYLIPDLIVHDTDTPLFYRINRIRWIRISGKKVMLYFAGEAAEQDLGFSTHEKAVEFSNQLIAQTRSLVYGSSAQLLVLWEKDPKAMSMKILALSAPLTADDFLKQL